MYQYFLEAIYSVLGKYGHISYIGVPNKGLDLLKDRGILVSSLGTKVSLLMAYQS